MRVRLLYGTRAGEVVEMPYLIALRAMRSGTVEDLTPLPVRVPVPLTMAVTPVTVTESSSRPPRRGRPIVR